MTGKGKRLALSAFLSTLMRLALMVGAISFSYADAAGWNYLFGSDYALCDVLHERLNKYNYPDPLQQPNNCGWNVALSYPGFKEPPWQELDPKQHQELVYRLIKYKWSYGAPEKVLPQQEPFIHQEVQQFIQGGGRVQLWRTRLISNFYNKNHPVVWAPPGLQNVVQLRYALPANGKAEQAVLCPGAPWAGWYGHLFILNDELTDIHPAMGRAGNILDGMTLILYKDRPYFLSWSGGLSVELGSDDGSGPSYFCQLNYIHI